MFIEEPLLHTARIEDSSRVGMKLSYSELCLPPCLVHALLRIDIFCYKRGIEHYHGGSSGGIVHAVVVVRSQDGRDVATSGGAHLRLFEGKARQS